MVKKKRRGILIQSFCNYRSVKKLFKKEHVICANTLYKKMYRFLSSIGKSIVHQMFDVYYFVNY